MINIIGLESLQFCQNWIYLQEEIGEGGSSDVYIAELCPLDLWSGWTRYQDLNIENLDSLENPKVAIKLIKSSKQYSDRYSTDLVRREIKVWELGQHPNLVKILGFNDHQIDQNEFFQSPNAKYIVYELCQSFTLGDIIKHTGKLGETWKLLFLQLCWAVEFLHLQGCWHLDLKLSNVLLDHNCNVKLSDFGCSVFNQQDEFGFKRGTFGYMAPEVLNLSTGQTYDTYKADIYSLGICLYVLMTGKLPNEWDDLENGWHSTGSSLCKWIDCQNSEWQYEEVSLPTWIPEQVELLLESMLCPNPDKRPSIEEVLSDPWLNDVTNENLIEETGNEMHHRILYLSSIA